MAPDEEVNGLWKATPAGTTAYCSLTTKWQERVIDGPIFLCAVLGVFYCEPVCLQEIQQAEKAHDRREDP